MYCIIGSNGYLGRYCIQNILGHTADNIVATARDTRILKDTERIRWEQCDIAKEDEFDGLITKLRQYDQVKVIFLAAYHNPDLVAQNPQYAWNINVTSLSRCINKLNFVDKLFYASTDSVYGNSIGNYHFKETDALNPVNIYGKNKAAAEAVVQYSGFNVIRFPFLIGPCLVPDKKHFYDKIVDSLQKGETVEMFENSYRSSLHFNTASELLIRLMESSQQIPSVLNICGDKDLSKYEIGLMIADKLKVPRELIKPVMVFENDGIFKTKRAVSTLMDNTLVKNLLQLNSIVFYI